MEISRLVPGQQTETGAGEVRFEWPLLENARPVVLISLPAVLLLLLTVPRLATGYWSDEVFSITASRSLSGLFRMFREYENNMSLYQVILYFWMRLFGESETATHLLSLLVALATLPLFFRLQRTWFNKTTSFFGLLLLSVSPLFSYDAVETRSYAMLIFCVTLSTLLFVRLLQRPRYGTALAYGLCVGGSAYIHYFGVMIPLVHVFLLTRKNLNPTFLLLLVCAGVTAALVVSPLVLFPPKSKSQVDWIVAPNLKNLWYVFSALFGSGFVIVLLAGALFFVFRNGYWKKGAERGYVAEKLAVVWAFVPVIFLFAFSVFIKPLFIIRFFAWVVPGATLFTTLAILCCSGNRTIRTAVWIVVLGIFTFKSVLFLNSKGAGFKDTVQYLRQRVNRGDAVLVYPYFWTLSVNYYLDQAQEKEKADRPVPITRFDYLGGGGGTDPDPALDVVERTAHRAERIFLVCNGNAQLSKGDSNQRRIYLPQIKTILASDHRLQMDSVFGVQTQSPVRVLVFE